MEWYMYVLAVAGGMIAGFVNTLAGSGSFITLPLLIFMGLPANVANGSNRIGIIVQTLVAAKKLEIRNEYSLKQNMRFILPVILGSFAGAFIAVDVDEKVFRYTIGVVMVLMLLPIMLNSESWLRKSPVNKNTNKILSAALFFIMGVYGGFIQAGVGIFILTALILLNGFDLIYANWLKNIIALLFNIPVFLIFLYHNQVDWYLGGLIAIGQLAGAWISAHFATEHQNSQAWIRRLLIAVIIVSAIELFEVRQMLF